LAPAIAFIEMSPAAQHSIRFTLEPVPPFRLDLTVWTLRRRPDNAVDRWDGQTYRRVLPLAGGAVDVAVTQTGPPQAPQLRVHVTGAELGRGVRTAVRLALERLLGLRIDLSDFSRLASQERRMESLVRRFRGMKPPRFPTVFESLANAIACQQVTLTLGIRLLNRLAETAGPTSSESDPPAHAFPRPQDLAGQDREALRSLGFSQQKAQALIELARAVAEGNLDLEGLVHEPDEIVRDRLCQLRGVGRWTAEYAMLRGLGRLHIFPGDDVGGQNNLRRWLGRTEPLDYEGVHRALARWRPYAGLVYLHLLLDRLAEMGAITEDAQPEA
jgi:DNA-3-methyladenine glycosylase II